MTHRRLLLLMLTAALVAPAAAGGRRWRNVLRNPSFEAVGAKGLPGGWTWQQGWAKATIVVDGAQARSGERSIRIVTSRFRPSKWARSMNGRANNAPNSSRARIRRASNNH